MVDRAVREGFFLRESRVVESFAARASRREADGKLELPSWAPREGGMKFEYAFVNEFEEPASVRGNVTFAVRHRQSEWAISVTLDVEIGGPAAALEGLRGEPRPYLGELGEVYWPEIRAAVKAAANAIEARVKVPPIHPARWAELKSQNSRASDAATP